MKAIIVFVKIRGLEKLDDTLKKLEKTRKDHPNINITVEVGE